MLNRVRFSVAAAITIFSIGFSVACNSSSSNGGAPSPAGSASAGSPGKIVHDKPVCAVQDCATHKVVDTGCTPSGECASCINFCPPQNSITVNPSATPPNQH